MYIQSAKYVTLNNVCSHDHINCSWPLYVNSFVDSQHLLHTDCSGFDPLDIPFCGIVESGIDMISGDETKEQSALIARSCSQIGSIWHCFGLIWHRSAT